MEMTKRFLGVNKRGSNKTRKSNKNRLINKVVDYLKSDYYMFAPLVSSQPLNVSNTDEVFASSYFATRVDLSLSQFYNRSVCSKPFLGLEDALTPTKGKKKNLLNKAEEYLKSDLYMYSPIVEPQLSNTVLAGTPLTKATNTSGSPSPRKIIKKTEQPSKNIGKAPLSEESVVRRPISLRETVKHKVHRNCRLCSAPGKKSARNQAEETRGMT